MVRTSGKKTVGELSSSGITEVGGNVEVKGSIVFTTTGAYYNYIMSNGNGTTIANENRVRIATGSPPSSHYIFTENEFVTERMIRINAYSTPAIEIDASTMPNEIVIKDTSTNNSFSLRYDGSRASMVLYDASNNVTVTPFSAGLSDIRVSRNIIPSGGVNLGNDTARFGALYLSGNIFSNAGASFTGNLMVGSTCSIALDTHISGNLMVDGSLSVGGTKNAAVPSKSYPENMDLRIKCAALESPFWSGIYIIDKITTQNGTYEYQLPPYFKEAVDLNHLFVILTPEGKFVQYYYEIQDDKIIVHSSEDATFTIMVIGRRWDNELIEDVRREVWVNEFEGSNK